MTEFTPVEGKLIEYAADDFAAQYYGGPFAFGVDDAARYVTEGHLRTLQAAYGLGPVADAVAAYLRQHPEVLHRSPAERKRAAQARAEEWDRLVKAAGKAYKARELDRARKLIDDAEAVEPRRSVAGYRSKIDAAAGPVLTTTAGGAR
ncbi:hypothetical protein [Nocardia terpenica]|uniref:Uncharacterized protein n=1 Tax=Nocardia terpenica TaxID=455432 RepID=A0A291RYV2_9NOCA|nr:hypothetical protein [Nocardia terpenica]ATL72497.1 hypothetical protein CRH09_39685 [Nocardia terpenica]